MLKIVNVGRATPLVAERDIYDAQPNGLADVHRVYPEWRNRLRQEYGLPEKPLPAALAVPEQVLTQPAWSAAIPTQEDLAGRWRLVPSPDGQWLALLSREVVTLWQSDTGKLAWQPPSIRARADGYPTVAGDVAFTATSLLFMFDHGDYGRFRTWNLATHEETGKVLLSGKPTSGVDDGRYSFDRTAQRMAFAGYNDLGCSTPAPARPCGCTRAKAGLGFPSPCPPMAHVWRPAAARIFPPWSACMTPLPVNGCGNLIPSPARCWRWPFPALAGGWLPPPLPMVCNSGMPNPANYCKRLPGRCRPGTWARRCFPLTANGWRQWVPHPHRRP